MIRKCACSAALVALAASFIPVASATAADPVAWKFEPGEVFDWSISQEISSDSGRGQKSSQNAYQDARLEVVATEAEKTTFRFTVRRGRVKVTDGEDVILEFDTDDPQKHADALKLIERTIGRPLTEMVYEIDIDPHGRALRIEAQVDDLDLDAPPQTVLNTGLLHKDSFNQPMMGGLLALPAEGFKPGGSWTLPGGGGANPALAAILLRHEITHKGPEEFESKSYERFDIALPKEDDDGEFDISNGLIKMKFHREEGGGHVLFDAAAGRMYRLEFEVKASMVGYLDDKEIPQGTMHAKVVSVLSPAKPDAAPAKTE